MGILKVSSESQHQLAFDLTEEELIALEEEHKYDDLLNLLEEILTEVFVPVEDEESFDHLCGRAIYDLADEKEILSREKYERESLDEGSPAVEDFERLKIHAEAYFERPHYYPMKEEDFKANHVTGFIQIYGGEKFDASGNMKEFWKSFGNKVVARVTDLYDPQKVITLVEEQGIKWNSMVRICFYGAPLEELIGSRSYGEKESKEFVPLNSEYENILLALPDDCQVQVEFDNTYEFVESLLSDNISTSGVSLGVYRVTLGHWELTKARLDELELEEAEESNLLRFSTRERDYVSNRNKFIEDYKEASLFIEGLNSGKSRIDHLYAKDTKFLDQVLFLAERVDKRINNPAAFAQIKSLAIKLRTNQMFKSKEEALGMIRKINSGDTVELHLLSLFLLEDIFSILWGNIGIKIITEKKEIYFQLKERLLRLRSTKPGYSSQKGR